MASTNRRVPPKVAVAEPLYVDSVVVVSALASRERFKSAREFSDVMSALEYTITKMISDHGDEEALITFAQNEGPDEGRDQYRTLLQMKYLQKHVEVCIRGPKEHP